MSRICKKQKTLKNSVLFLCCFTILRHPHRRHHHYLLPNLLPQTSNLFTSIFHALLYRTSLRESSQDSNKHYAENERPQKLIDAQACCLLLQESSRSSSSALPANTPDHTPDTSKTHHSTQLSIQESDEAPPL